MHGLLQSDTNYVKIKANYPKPEAMKNSVCVCVFLLRIQHKFNLMNFDTLSVAIYISLYKMQNIHLKLEQSAVPVTPGTRQRQDSLYDILNYSSQTSPVLFLLVSVSWSNAAWQLALADLHRNQIMTLESASWKITPPSCHLCPQLERLKHQLEVTVGRFGSLEASTDQWSSYLKVVLLLVARSSCSP